MLLKELKFVYEIGSIVELKVEKILTDNQLIVFDLDGIPAQLKKEELSNSPVLCNKLFNVIREGEQITSVIIEFNEDKEYVELSIKPLRNQLEGSLSFTKCRKIIQKRKESRLNLESDYIQENRNQLDRIQGDLAKVDLTFLYELIQNAIDHPNPQFDNKLLIKFEVYNDYLLLKHNGSIFTEDNFRSLTGILLGEEETKEDRIGYKGIGFKSIFRYTQDVYVRSGNFSFSFSKKRTGAQLPWEVIPIFENEIDKVDEIKNFEFFNTPVAFAFKFSNHTLKEQAIAYLSELIETPQTLLFLDKLARLEVVIDEQVETITRSVQIHETHEKILLQLNDDEPEEWLVCKEKQVITDQTILDELKDENNPSIPLKFRYFKTPQIQIALPLSPREDLINMYAHLPLSDTKYSLPYIINGDFIPNLDRADIIKNLKYNYCLSELGASAVIQLIKVVSKECSLRQAIELITAIEITEVDFFKKMNISVMNKKPEIKVFHNSENEYPLEKLVFDESGLFTIVSQDNLINIEEFAGCILIDKIDNLKSLVEDYGVKKFSFEHAITLLNVESVRDTYFKGIDKLAVFIFRLSRLEQAEKWKKYFSKVLINIDGDKESYLNDYFILNNPKYLSAFGKILVPKPLPEKWAIALNEHPNIKDVFVKFGLNQFSLHEILKALLAHEVPQEINEDESFEYLNYIWAYLFSKKDIKNSDGGKRVNERFKTFSIFTTSGSISPLENTFVGDVNSIDLSYSYLHRNFGETSLLRADLSKIALIAGVKSKEILDFLQTIHEDIKITERRLFKKALNNLLNTEWSELENKEPESLIRALISVYKYSKENPKEDLLKFGIINFPVVCQDKSIEKMSLTYFDKSYSFVFNDNTLFAHKMFKDVEGIKFVSTLYLESLDTIEKEGFVSFLQKYYVSPGIKAIPGQLLKKKDRINISAYDNIYGNFNRGYTNFRSASEFLILKDIGEISGKFDALVLFWEHLKDIKNFDLLTNNIVCNNYQRINPFVWLLNLKQLKLYPMRDGSVRSVDEIYSKELSEFLLEDKAKLHSCFDNINPNLSDNLDFRDSLNNIEIISGLRLLNNLPVKLRSQFLLDYFSQASFTDDELELIKKDSYFLAKDQSLQHISNLVYFDKKLEETSLAINQEGFPLSQQIFTFDFDDSFKNQIQLVDIPIKTKSDIEVSFISNKDDTASNILQISINEFVENESLQSPLDFDKSIFIQSSNIKLRLNKLNIYTAEVDYFYDSQNNSYYFLTIRDLADLICEENEWSPSINKKLRKLLDKVVIKNSNKVDSEKNNNIQDRYAIDELEQIKSLFNRELDANELMSENLFAQVKALRFFKDKGYDIANAELNFENNYCDRYLDPIIDENGDEIKVLCRSARRGVLFLGGYAWMNLASENTILYLLTGETSTECVVINSTEELENKFPTFFKVIRRTNTEFLDVKNLVESENEVSELQLLYKVRDGVFDIIFNPQQNEPGETEGGLIDDDI